MSYYEVEVERRIVQRGIVIVKASKAKTARRRAEQAVSLDSDHITWESPSERESDVRCVREMEQAPPYLDAVITE